MSEVTSGKTEFDLMLPDRLCITYVERCHLFNQPMDVRERELIPFWDGAIAALCASDALAVNVHLVQMARDRIVEHGYAFCHNTAKEAREVFTRSLIGDFRGAYPDLSAHWQKAMKKMEGPEKL